MEQEKVTISLEEKVEKVKDLRPIDDVFFEVLADDIQMCIRDSTGVSVWCGSCNSQRS